MPPITGYRPSPDDPIAVQQTDSGIKVSWSINGVGYLAETIEYRNNIGFRLTVNEFNACANATVFSNNFNLYVSLKNNVYQVLLDPDIDCNTYYTDSWQVLRKLAQCQQLPHVINETDGTWLYATNVRTFPTIIENSPQSTCGGRFNVSRYTMVDSDQPELETNPYDETHLGPTFNDVAD